MALSGAALAQPADPAAARTLYEAGGRAVAAGDWDAACPKFQASLQLERRASTQYYVGKCTERRGQLTAALEHFRASIALSVQVPDPKVRKLIEEQAQKAISELEPRIGKLRITVRGGPPDVQVLRDGAIVPAGALGEALPIDPGTHRVAATSASQRFDTLTVQIGEGKSVDVELRPVVGAVPVASHGAAGSSVSSRFPAWIWIVGSAGVAFAAVGTGFLVDDLGAIRSINERCPTRDAAGRPDCTGSGLSSEAIDSLNARKNRDLPLTVGFYVASIACLGASITGLTLAAMRPTAEPPKAALTPWFGGNQGGLLLSGSF